jgi:predicted ATPase
VTLLGPPGIGKTRLAAELRAVVPDVQWLIGRSISYGDGLPYYALRQAVRTSLGMLESDAADVAEARLAREDGWVAASLRLLVGLQSAAAGDQRETFAAWRHYLESQAARAPTALLLEDLH